MSPVAHDLSTILTDSGFQLKVAYAFHLSEVSNMGTQPESALAL